MLEGGPQQHPNTSRDVPDVCPRLLPPFVSNGVEPEPRRPISDGSRARYLMVSFTLCYAIRVMKALPLPSRHSYPVHDASALA